MHIYPLKFKPIYKYRIWGGRKLESFYGKKLPPGQKIGESWELADLPKDKSVIANGELTGSTLQEAIRKYPKEITGNMNFKPPFPLLIKLLDIQDITSVQVHPDVETCRRMGKGKPKAECWYIIDAAPGAFIYKGLKEGVTKEKFAKAIKKGTVEVLLEKVMVHSGESHYLHAGTVHSIGPGILLAEIQTPSDTTYRVYDFNRIEKNGLKRPLHINEAMESIHFESSRRPTVTTSGRLLNCTHCKVEKSEQAAERKVKMSCGKMKVLIAIKGKGRIETEDKIVTEFAAGDVILIPACLKGEMVFDTLCEYLSAVI